MQVTVRGVPPWTVLDAGELQRKLQLRLPRRNLTDLDGTQVGGDRFPAPEPVIGRLGAIARSGPYRAERLGEVCPIALREDGFKVNAANPGYVRHRPQPPRRDPHTSRRR